jgi:hypothetical protein
MMQVVQDEEPPLTRSIRIKGKKLHFVYVPAEQQHIIEPFQPGVSHRRKNQTARDIQRRRKAADKLSPWTELVGVRLPKPDDPILLQFKKADDDSRPLRLVMYVRQH